MQVTHQLIHGLAAKLPQPMQARPQRLEVLCLHPFNQHAYQHQHIACLTGTKLHRQHSNHVVRAIFPFTDNSAAHVQPAAIESSLQDQQTQHIIQACKSMALPRHIAVIMDGNARWAAQRGMPATFGHEAGAQALQRLVEMCCMLNIPALTVYAFSMENWQRPEAEVNFLMRLFEQTLDRQLAALHKADVRVLFIGNRTCLPLSLVARMEHAEQLTCDNKGLVLTIAVAYSGRDDLTTAARRIAALAAQGLIDPDKVDASMLESHLSTASVSKEVGLPDLLIRTSGEHRLSNFLLYELAYCELHFATVHWPDFNKTELLTALQSFNSRQRRFGQRTSE